MLLNTDAGAPYQLEELLERLGYSKRGAGVPTASYDTDRASTIATDSMDLLGVGWHNARLTFHLVIQYGKH